MSTARIGLAATVLALMGLGAVGCSVDPEPEPQTPSQVELPGAPSSPAPATIFREVGNPALGKASAKLLRGKDSVSDEQAECIGAEVRATGVSGATMQYLVSSADLEPEKVLNGLDGADKDDLASLKSKSLDQRLTQCMDIVPAEQSKAPGLPPADPEADEAIASEHAAASEQAPEPTQEAEPTAAAETNLPEGVQPQYEVTDSTDVEDPKVLGRGIGSIIGSFEGVDPKKAEAAGVCVAEAVLAQDFSPQGLRFLAEGAPLGSGSIGEYLPASDRGKWNSEQMQQTVMDCLG